MYFPSDSLITYKRYKLQAAILEYIANHNGTDGKGAQATIDLGEYMGETLIWKCYPKDMSEAIAYLESIGLITSKSDCFYITDAGLECLQKYSLQSLATSAYFNYINSKDRITCIVISILALAASITALLLKG